MTAVLPAPRRTVVRLDRPRVSGVVFVRLTIVCLVLTVLTAVALCVSLALGDYPVSLPHVVQALFGKGDETEVLIVRDLRLPRAVTGLLVGMCFGAAGALFQSMARNPLASPDIIGITEGASTAAVAGIVLGFGANVGRPLLAFGGGLATALLIYFLAWKRGTTGYRIVLVGIGISAVCAALTDYLLLKAQIFQVQQALVWLVGDLNARGWEDVRLLLVAMAFLLPISLAAGYRLNALELGDDAALGLGVRVQLARLYLMLAGVGLVSFATCVAGPIAFVSLMAPQVAVRLAGLARPPLLASALTGALLVVVADTVAQHAFPSVSLPVGVVTGVIGGPFLLWLLVRTNSVGSGG